MSHQPTRAGGQQSLRNYYDVLSETDDIETPQSPQVGAQPVHISSSSESIARYPNFCDQVFDEQQVNFSTPANSAGARQSTAQHHASTTQHPICSDTFTIVHHRANMRKESSPSVQPTQPMSQQDPSSFKSSTVGHSLTSKSSHCSLAGPASADAPTQCMTSKPSTGRLRKTKANNQHRLQQHSIKSQTGCNPF